MLGQPLHWGKTNCPYYTLQFFHTYIYDLTKVLSVRPTVNIALFVGDVFWSGIIMPNQAEYSMNFETISRNFETIYAANLS